MTELVSLTVLKALSRASAMGVHVHAGLVEQMLMSAQGGPSMLQTATDFLEWAEGRAAPRFAEPGGMNVVEALLEVKG